MSNANENETLKIVSLCERIFFDPSSKIPEQQQSLAPGNLEYRLTEYVIADGWVMSNRYRHTDSLTIGPHEWGVWVPGTLSVSIPRSGVPSKIVAQNITANIGTHIRISSPSYSNDDTSCSWHVESQVHDRYITFQGVIEYVRWGKIEYESKSIFNSANGSPATSPIGNGTYSIKLQKGYKTFSLYLRFPDGTETILTPAHLSERGVTAILDDSSEIKQLMLTVKFQ